MGNNIGIRGYKVFKSDWTCSPNGNTKQYTCPGKFEEDIAPIRCGRGMHFCKKAADCFNYYSFNPENKVAEVIAYGDIAEEGDKCCTNKLEIVREISWQEVLEIVNTGKGCTGLRNTGDWNSGNRNSGNWNSGDCNTGNRNSGDCNTGNRNSGDCNTGNRNSGDCNTGNWNSGNWNSGNWNSGNWNSGDCNTGDWNKSSFNTGCFMTEEPKIMLFNKPSNWTYRTWLESEARRYLNQIPKNVVEWIYSSDMTEEEKTAHPEHETTGGYLKILDETECAQMWWDGLTETKKDIIRSLPNFDEGIFEEITGIKL